MFARIMLWYNVESRLVWGALNRACKVARLKTISGWGIIVIGWKIEFALSWLILSHAVST